MSMTVDEIKFLREKYRAMGNGFIVYGDNMILSSEDTDAGSFIVWDDEHLVYHSFKPNRHPYYKQQAQFPISIQSTNYDQVQFINSSVDREAFEKFMDSLIDDGVLTADKKEEILQQYVDLKILP